MMTISEELYILFIAVWLGVIISGVYCILKTMRMLMKHKKIIVTIEDYLYWIITTFFMLTQIQIVCDGTIRWYFVCGIATGVVVIRVLWRSLEVMILRVQRKIKRLSKKRTKKNKKEHNPKD